MNETTLQMALRRMIALGTAVMLVASLSAIAVVRADNRPDELVSQDTAGTSGQFSGVAGGTAGAGAGGDLAAEPAAGETGAAAAPAEAPTDAPAPGATGGDDADAGGGDGAAPAPAAGDGGGAGNGGGAPAQGQQRASSGTDCPDYNPKQGVYCDHFLIGGTTVLSGPLAVYGDQGLKGGQAAITWFNTEVAPKEGLRKVKLIWYDDNLDPNKTLQFVQRMNEVDHVLVIAGVTSPEAISPYLLEAQCISRPGKDDCPLPGNKGLPFIGDIGLSPKSYTNPLIFPTAPNPEMLNGVFAKIIMRDYKPKSIAVIAGTLPGVDNTPYRKSWEKAAKDLGFKLAAYREMGHDAGDCSAQFQAVTQPKPEFLVLPVGAPAMLACMRAAKQYAVQPGSPASPWLKGWSGGSGLQVEVDNCRPTCDGMIAGTIFRDPDTSTTPAMQTYRKNMARYAPNVDYKGFIAVNYYANVPVYHALLSQKGIAFNLTRKTLVDAANSFGPYDTGFGNTVTWRPQLPRTPTSCLYKMTIKGDRWVYGDQQTCL